MRIALFGNMNNMLFQVARYLRDENHICTLFLFEEFEWFLPSADTYAPENNIYVEQTNWKRDNIDFISKADIKKIIIGFDFYIGTDIAPAYFFKAGYKLDIFYPHGSDLYEYSFFNFINKTPQLWELTNYFFGTLQYQGIAESLCIALDPSEDLYEIPLKKIKNSNFERIGSAPFLYKNQYTSGFEHQSSRLDEFVALRKKYDLIIWQHISQDWSDRGSIKINKGNHVLIEGFSNYIKQTNKKDKALLILLEYGTDVQKSKDYIKELGMDHYVMWIPKMLRKDIMPALTQVDFGIGELGYRRWFSYSSIFEYMQAGLPVIHHRGDDFYRSQGFDLYPMIDAKTPEILTKTFLDFENHKEKYQKIGSDSRAWAEDFFEKSMSGFFKQINNKSKDNLIHNYLFKSLRMRMNIEYLKYSSLFYYYKLKLLVKSILLK